MILWLSNLLFISMFASCTGVETELMFEHHNELHEKLWIPANSIAYFGIHAKKFNDVIMAGGQTMWLRTTETTDLRRFPEPLHTQNPNAAFRFLRYDLCLIVIRPGVGWICRETAHIEYMTMYWHHQHSDWRNHTTCMISSTLKEEAQVTSLRAKATANDCDDPVGKFSYLKLIIENAGANSMELSPPLNAGGFHRSEISMLYVEFLNNRQHHITINGAASLCIDMEDFTIGRKHKLEPGKTMRLKAKYRCGWGPKSILYFYINHLDSDGLWGVAKVAALYYFEEWHGENYRQCSVTSGAARQLGEIKKLTWQAGVRKCGQGMDDRFWVQVD